MDQVLKEQLPELNRSEFIRRAIRFTIDNVDDFKASESVSISETQSVEAVEKINRVRDLYTELNKFTEALQRDPNVPLTIKQLAFLNRLVGTMIFKMND